MTECVILFEIRGRFSLIPEPVGSLYVEAQTTQAKGLFVYTGEAEYAADSKPAFRRHAVALYSVGV